MTTVTEALREGITALTQYLANPVSARQEAHWLLAHVLSLSYTQLIVSHQRRLTADEYARYTQSINKRMREHIPLAYILGTVPFCGLTLAVEPPILIPRHETEELVSELIDTLTAYSQPLTILDVCTGSGCIALALAAHMPHAHIIGSDIDPQAITLANKNKAQLGLTNVSFVHSDLFTHLTGHTFDLIISNPPYLARTEWHELTPDVMSWEAQHALIGGESGLEYYIRIISQAHQFLTGSLKNSMLPELVFEYGSTQADALCALLTENGFRPPIVKRDSFNHCRALWATRL
jgi:release factor glutamine methyltransferase